MTAHEFQRIVIFVKQKSGIDLSQKRVLIEGRMENYLIRNGFQSYNEYMDKLEQEVSGKEVEKFLNIITTNHTYFMREFEHFDFLKEVVLPELKIKEQGSKDLRIWSAASSTGEEPYTIAMVLNDFFGMDKCNWDTTVLATDISTEVLQYAIRGRYLQEQISLIPDVWKKRYFKSVGEGWFEVKPELKKEVLFRQLNLMKTLPFKKKLHIVFIRNVMIYFEKETKNEVLNRIYECMEPGGYLFIGTTEFVDRDETKFQYICPSVFRK